MARRPEAYSSQGPCLLVLSAPNRVSDLRQVPSLRVHIIWREAAAPYGRSEDIGLC